MFRIKICGITSPLDAQHAAAAGADALGLNFYSQSPRFLSADRAAAVADAVPAGVAKVGLFVNASACQVRETFDELKLDLVQLHGDEPPEFLVELEGRPVMRAFRLEAANLGPVSDYLDRCRELGCLPRLVLIDGFRSGHYGGTGQAVDWRKLATARAALGEVPLVLAGGLTEANVAEAITLVRPAAVDTASGVESQGKKDRQRMQAFVDAARRALEAGSPCQPRPPVL